MYNESLIIKNQLNMNSVQHKNYQLNINFFEAMISLHFGQV